MPMIDSTPMNGAYSTTALGTIGSTNRYKPYVPSFSSTAASTTEPAVGASVCANGSHVCTGNSGTFTANPAINASRIHACSRDDNSLAKLVNVGISNDHAYS